MSMKKFITLVACAAILAQIFAVETASISFGSKKIKVTGSESVITQKDGVVTITEPCTVTVKGKSSNARIVIDVDKKAEGSVILSMEGTTLSNSDQAVIYAKSGNTVLSSKKGKKNTLSDGSEHSDKNAKGKAIDAAVYSESSLTIEGSGKITVKGNSKNAVYAKKLTLLSSIITVESVKHGLVGKDSVVIGTEGMDNKSLVVDVTTQEGDGIKGSNEDEEGKGTITIFGGTFKAKTGDDAFQGEGNVTVNGGNYTLHAQSKGITSKRDLTINNPLTVINVTYAEEGLEGKKHLVINDGNIKVNTFDDGINAGPKTEEEIPAPPEGGMFRHNGRPLPPDGNMPPEGSPFPDGNFPPDGMPPHDFGSRPPFMAGEIENESEQAAENVIIINGGRLEITSGTDCIDSNAGLKIAGGTLLCHSADAQLRGPTSILDSDNYLPTISGDVTIVAAMAKVKSSPIKNTTCNYFFLYLDENITGKTKVALYEGSKAKGNSCVSYTVEGDFGSLMIMGSVLQTGKTYTLSVGGKNHTFTVENQVTVIGTEPKNVMLPPPMMQHPRK